MTFLAGIFRLVMGEFETFSCLCSLFSRSDLLRSAFDTDSRRVAAA